jgi:hypothetical protein
MNVDEDALRDAEMYTALEALKDDDIDWEDDDFVLLEFDEDFDIEKLREDTRNAVKVTDSDWEDDLLNEEDE